MSEYKNLPEWVVVYENQLRKKTSFDHKDTHIALLHKALDDCRGENEKLKIKLGEHHLDYLESTSDPE